MKKYTAHIHPVTGREQTVVEHCMNTGEIAAEFLRSIGLHWTGKFLGRVHDIGKLKELFDDYIHKRIKADRGEIFHSGAAAKFLLSNFHYDPDSDEYIVAEILAVAAASHHGLKDCMDLDGNSCFRRWERGKGLDYEEVSRNLEAVGGLDLVELFRKSVEELSAMLDKLAALAERCPDESLREGELAFYVELLIRVMASALVDADRRDTAESMSNIRYPAPLSKKALTKRWEDVLERVEGRLAMMEPRYPIDVARKAISDACAEAAKGDRGCFRLCVGTGGGKTLSGLRFALAHAARHGMDHIMFTAPLLTIIDQNAAVLRDYICDDSMVLEHHSNVAHLDERHYRERAMLSEGWDAPVIITTAVQFMENLFSADMSCVRRLHSFCNSVIVMDEVQSVPNRLLTMFSLAVNFFCEACGSTIVLCSATQPAFRRLRHAIRVDVHDIPVPTDKFAEVFHRTNLQYAGTMGMEELARQALRKAESVGSTLVVCNKKKQARELFRMLKGSGARVFHLSASMCQDHRRRVLRNLVKALADKDDGRPVVCVSTQVIEAGVDISFASGFRVMAGLDRVAQTVGRVNRNGELGAGVLGDVYIVDLAGEDLSRLPDIRNGKLATLETISEYERNPEGFRGRLDSDEALEYYYQALYRIEGEDLHDYPVKDGVSIYSMLSTNDAVALSGRRPADANQVLYHAARTAGLKFHVFDSGTVDVIVPYGRGAELIRELGSQRALDDMDYARSRIREAAAYTVALRESELAGLRTVPLAGGAIGLCGNYDPDVGFLPDVRDDSAIY